MKVRKLLVTGAVAALALTACSNSSNGDGTGAVPENGTLTVWLQTDAQQGWPAQVAAATTAFTTKHPGWKVDVQYQTWGDHLTKLDAALAGSSAPDVVELGNTEMTKYMAAGALADLTSKKGSFDNSGAWLKSLEDSATYDNALYGVPYYAGSRAVIYRTDQYAAAGVTAPKTFAEFKALNTTLTQKYGSDPNYSSYYFPGKYWYAAMSYVYDAGGQIATHDGSTWTGTLDSAQAQAGLTELKAVVDAYSKADKTGDEAKQDAAFAQGKIGSIYANGWERGVITDPKAGNPALAGKLGAYPMPSATHDGQYMPAFLGGSDLAVTAKSQNVGLAAEWIADFTSTKNMADLVAKAGVLPNNTTQLNLISGDNAPFALAAQNSWFVPTAENWANVEKANVIPNMLSDIFTGKATVAEATAAASQQITQILNGS